jgi:Fe-S cluster biogenesis protein NfuA
MRWACIQRSSLLTCSHTLGTASIDYNFLAYTLPSYALDQNSGASQVRPYLMADGGNVEFVEVDGLVVKLRLKGACGSCPSSLTTMTMGIKRRLMERIPVSSHHMTA